MIIFTDNKNGVGDVQDMKLCMVKNVFNRNDKTAKVHIYQKLSLSELFVHMNSPHMLELVEAFQHQARYLEKEDKRKLKSKMFKDDSFLVHGNRNNKTHASIKTNGEYDFDDWFLNGYVFCDCDNILPDSSDETRHNAFLVIIERIIDVFKPIAIAVSPSGKGLKIVWRHNMANALADECSVYAFRHAIKNIMIEMARDPILRKYQPGKWFDPNPTNVNSRMYCTTNKYFAPWFNESGNDSIVDLKKFHKHSLSCKVAYDKAALAYEKYKSTLPTRAATEKERDEHIHNIWNHEILSFREDGIYDGDFYPEANPATTHTKIVQYLKSNGAPYDDVVQIVVKWCEYFGVDDDNVKHLHPLKNDLTELRYNLNVPAPQYMVLDETQVTTEQWDQYSKLKNDKNVAHQNMICWGKSVCVIDEFSTLPGRMVDRNRAVLTKEYYNEGRVANTDVFDKITDAMNAGRLTILCTNAGAGKTTAVAQYIKQYFVQSLFAWQQKVKAVLFCTNTITNRDAFAALLEEMGINVRVIESIADVIARYLASKGRNDDELSIVRAEVNKIFGEYNTKYKAAFETKVKAKGYDFTQDNITRNTNVLQKLVKKGLLTEKERDDVRLLIQNEKHIDVSALKSSCAFVICTQAVQANPSILTSFDDHPIFMDEIAGSDVLPLTPKRVESCGILINDDYYVSAYAKKNDTIERCTSSGYVRFKKVRELITPEMKANYEVFNYLFNSINAGRKKGVMLMSAEDSLTRAFDDNFSRIRSVYNLNQLNAVNLSHKFTLVDHNIAYYLVKNLSNFSESKTSMTDEEWTKRMAIVKFIQQIYFDNTGRSLMVICDGKYNDGKIGQMTIEGCKGVNGLNDSDILVIVGSPTPDEIMVCKAQFGITDDNVAIAMINQDKINQAIGRNTGFRSTETDDAEGYLCMVLLDTKSFDINYGPFVDTCSHSVFNVRFEQEITTDHGEEYAQMLIDKKIAHSQTLNALKAVKQAMIKVFDYKKAAYNELHEFAYETLKTIISDSIRIDGFAIQSETKEGLELLIEMHIDKTEFSGKNADRIKRACSAAFTRVHNEGSFKKSRKRVNGDPVPVNVYTITK